MNRILRGAVLLAVSAVVGACSSDSGPTEDGPPVAIKAEPSAVFISRADSEAVALRVVDKQGTSVLQPIMITNVGPGINVRADSAYRPIYHGDTLIFNPNTTELQVWVSTSALANSSFTVTSGDLTLDVPVVVTPNKDESFPFSTLTPALGEVVTANVSSDLLFTDSTQIIFGADTLDPISLSETSLSFNAGPDLLGPAVFTNVTLSYNKNIVFPVTAADTLNSPPSAQAFVFSNLTPGIGEQITITPPAGVVFSPTTEVTFDSLGPVPHFTIAAGGTSMTLTAGPNSVGPTTFTKMFRPDNPTFTFDLSSADTLKSAGVTTFPVTTDKTSAAANEVVTYTGGTPLYKFDFFNTLFTVNDTPALLVGVSADSSQAQVLPAPGTSTGATKLAAPVVAGFLLDSLPTNGPAITVAALGAPQAGTDAFATAPNINAPAVGQAVAFWDGGPYSHATSFGDGERLYKLTVATTGNYTLQLPFISDGSDLGIYFYDGSEAPITTAGFFVDAGGEGAAESKTLKLTAGTYYIAIVWFDYTDPATLFGFRIAGAP